ncbi:SRPBCC domain-containing protein [Agrococcus beijingensis]|uniref:SRPBCC domain-containing protein n=1 Tax=Agrococcus beijingensis TaxID=3068634 RepID=UPI0027408020|nr:SRPBCC domain-containing protein [Agrococcus sp. REN33]
MSNALAVETLPNQPLIDFTREFDAPAAAVYAAHADPELYVQWVGPAKYTTRVTEWEHRSGGAYRFVQSDAGDDREHGFRGAIHTARPGEMLIQTFEWEGAPDEVSLDIIRFEDLPGGRSRIVARSVFPSIENLHAMLQAGMTDGMEEGYRQLDAMLAAER